MDPGPLDMLQDARDQYRLTVADGIDVELAAQQILVDQDRTANAERDGGIDVTAQILSRMYDLHPSTAQNVRRPNQHRVSDPARDGQRVVGTGGRTTRGLWDAAIT